MQSILKPDVCILLKEVLFNERKPEFESNRKIKAYNIYLNESQIRSIEHSLAAKDLAIVHGPPGTGKTTTVVEIII